MWLSILDFEIISCQDDRKPTWHKTWWKFNEDFHKPLQPISKQSILIKYEWLQTYGGGGVESIRSHFMKEIQARIMPMATTATIFSSEWVHFNLVWRGGSKLKLVDISLNCTKKDLSAFDHSPHECFLVTLFLPLLLKCSAETVLIVKGFRVI